MFLYILINKAPVPCESTLEWGQWFQKTHPNRVGDDVIGKVRVSTVFLGIDHQFGEGPPMLFETMIFGGPRDLYQERYSTWDEAEAGHRRAVELVRSDEPYREFVDKLTQ